jgi:hypothetical protein
VIPLGQPEGQKLELKGTGASPLKVARAIVALLNADGGEVWWGIEEKDGVAQTVEPLDDPAAKRDALLNHLVDTLEPPPLDEMKIDVIPSPAHATGQILRIRVAKGRRGPYAQIDKGRHYWLRVGSRTRTMTHEELQAAFRGSSEPPPRRLPDGQHPADKWTHFWMSVTPDPKLVLELQNERFDELLTNPQKSGNRPTGWTFAVRRGEVKPRAASLSAELERFQRIEIWHDGLIEFRGSYDRLNHSNNPAEIYPYALIEFPLSVLRLARAILLDGQVVGGSVHIDLALFSATGRVLRKGSPRDFLDEELVPFPDPDLILPRPLTFSTEELVASPELCNLRLVSQIYLGFGYRERDLPPELDRKTGVLSLGV